ncbi:MAG: UDP-N-acetylmuramate--L-alanine ligase [Anaerolineales bacterium]|nr:UDP-N-acetylmuramate--L-alanine ligase [Anaerolineales bacterium]
MSAIATVLLERGYAVSGSDRQFSPMIRNLQEAGARVFLGHDADHVAGVDLVLRSSAVPDDNVEVQAAFEAGIPVLKRSDFLGELTSGQQAIAVAGTHGKTTTTAMIAWALADMGLDPSYVIGGASVNLGRNAHAGLGRYFVIEADEYDRMFLGLRPQVAVVTNVEHDHPDCYPTLEDFQQAFREFAARIEPGGVLAACGDDPGARQLLVEAAPEDRLVVSYGIRWEGCHYRASNLALNRMGGFDFDLLRQGEGPLASIRLQTPGEHNVLNALATLAVADQLGLDLGGAAASLGEFRGVGRRFELRGEASGVTVIDDYAHHPTEIRATLAAAKARFPGRVIWAVWQPHTFSRTRTLLDDFLAAFGDADHVLVMEIYAAREAPPPDGFSACQVVQALRGGAGPGGVDAYYAANLQAALELLTDRLQPGDVALVLSAGDAIWISERLMETLPSRGLA